MEGLGILMAVGEATPMVWKGRRAWRLSNGLIELTVLLGGGHIADFRSCGSPCNVLFESPWSTIEPCVYSPGLHSEKYGEAPVGTFLSSFTGHALVLGYFGMPSPAETARGLPLHGEAACAEWQVLSSAADDARAYLLVEASLPQYQLRVKRTLSLLAGAASALVEEQVTNIGKADLDYQWVEHATFGEPFFAAEEAQLFISAKKGRTWPEGYEGKELLISDSNFDWPWAQARSGERVDLSQAFLRSGTGFVAALLTEAERPHGFFAVHNQRLKTVAGYFFDSRRFPWIALWEENCARQYTPWNGKTRARGVEFGTSPMPTGLEKARLAKTLFHTPVFATLPARETVTTSYQLFTTAVPADWRGIADVDATETDLRLRDGGGQSLRIPASRIS
jgi:Domain of unknown function (DUF4432)